jgi:hypothetical protein
MKAYLMFPDRDLDLEQALPEHASALDEDLALGTLFDVMARGDEFLRERAQKTLLSGSTDPELILYRQRVIADCLQQPDASRRLYELAVEGIECKTKARHFWFHDSPDALLDKSLRILVLLADVLRELRAFVDANAGAFRSEGFTRLFNTLQRELDEEYLATVDEHLHALKFPRGALISASLGRGNRGTGYVLRKPRKRSLLDRITPGGRSAYSFTVPARDENGFRTLGDLRGHGINQAANALAQSVDHILSFCAMLRAELGFYIGCLNLHEAFTEKGLPTCFPVPSPVGDGAFSAARLCDAALAFHLNGPVIGNDIDATGKELTVITGANQGGKSTFLRSVGIAQLMMQAGMFVAAESFRASVSSGVFTHFKREEDPTMTRGKLDEELHRMSEIANAISPHSLLLCNESFSSTNEAEGSEIARQVTRAMIKARIRVFFVTHLFDLASSLRREPPAPSLFLRAERMHDGRRTFRMAPGEPLPTSFGEDSYRRIFALDDEDQAAVRAPADNR